MARSKPRLVVIFEPTGDAVGDASAAQVREYKARGTVDGSRDRSIGLRYTDKRGNDVAEPLDVAEVIAFESGLLKR